MLINYTMLTTIKLPRSTSSSTASSSSVITISPLQWKGLMTLSLFLVAQNVAFVNAIAEDRYYSSFSSSNGGSSNRNSKNSPFGQQRHDHDDEQQDVNVNTCHDSSSSQPPPPPQHQHQQQPVLFHRLWQSVRRIGKKKKKETSRDTLCCSQECAPCMDQAALDAACQRVAQSIPRGGHGNHAHSHSHAHDAVVDVAAEVLHSAAATTPYNIPLNAWKVIFQAILTVINVLCWLIPLRNKAISENQLAMSLANAFSGGVFLSLAFGHLIPECIHGFDLNIWSEATPFLFVLFGYLLIFFVEKVAFDAHDILHEMQAGGTGGSGHSHGHHGHAHHAHSHEHHDDHDSKTIKASNGSTSAAAVAVVTNDNKEDSPANSSNSAANTTGRSALILLCALGIHSILEMMALGLTKTFSDGALLTLSIALHQPAESIALLVAFLKSGMPKSQILQYLSIFACMGPIGVALGMAVNEYAAPVVDSIMLSIVAGTFVYVGATEVIPEEWEDSTHKWKKFAALMSGIVTILCITQYTMTFHSH